MDSTWQAIRSQLHSSLADNDSVYRTDELIDKSLLFTLSAQNERYYYAQKEYALYVRFAQDNESKMLLHASDVAYDVYKYRYMYEDSDLENKRIFYKLKQFCRIYGIRSEDQSIAAMLGAVFGRVRSFDTPEGQRNAMSTATLRSSELQLLQSPCPSAYVAPDHEISSLYYTVKRLISENYNLKNYLAQIASPIIAENQELYEYNYELQSRIVNLEDALLRRSYLTVNDQPCAVDTSQIRGGYCLSLLHFISGLDDGLADLARMAGFRESGAILDSKDYETSIYAHMQHLRQFVIDSQQYKARIQHLESSHASESVLKSYVDEWYNQLAASRTEPKSNQLEMAILRMDQEFADVTLKLKKRLDVIDYSVEGFSVLEASLRSVGEAYKECYQVCKIVFEKTKSLHEELQYKQYLIEMLKYELITNNKTNYIAQRRVSGEREFHQIVHDRLLYLSDITELCIDISENYTVEYKIEAIFDYLCDHTYNLVSYKAETDRTVYSYLLALNESNKLISKYNATLQALMARDDEFYSSLHSLKACVGEKVSEIEGNLDSQDYSYIEALLCAVLRVTRQLAERADGMSSEGAVYAVICPKSEDWETLLTNIVATLESIPRIEESKDEPDLSLLRNACLDVIYCDKEVFNWLIDKCGEELERCGCLYALREYWLALPDSLID